MIGQHYVNIGGQRLNQYRTSSGGGMSGGYSRETVKRLDDTHALVTVEKAEWYSQDPEINEYLVDVSIMDELEENIRKNRMNFWHRKKFTNLFIADGETDGYSFTFDKNEVRFSSQYYPPKYSRKLERFGEIIEKYLQNARKLPGLVRKGGNPNPDIPEGVLDIYVCSYNGETIGVKILNGKDEPAEIACGYRIVQADTGKTIAEKKDESTETVNPQSMDTRSFPVTERLGEGSYKLLLGDMEIPFEIR